MEEIPFAIIGAGVVGLQTAYALLEEGVPAEDIAIFEQNPYPGEHSSSRNSGVLHAGIYYPKDSLKQKYCLEGNLLWRKQAQELKLDLNEIGKYIIATSDEEISELEKLYSFANQKLVPDLRWISNDEQLKLNNFVDFKKGFYSKSTAILDCGQMITCLSDYLIKKGVMLLTSQKIELIKNYKSILLKVNSDIFTAEKIINSAGLFAVELRKQLGLKNIDNNYVKGNYLKLTKKYFTDSLIYPLPDEGLKGLGIHTIVQADGSILFGPDTEDVDSISYEMDESMIINLHKSISRIFKNVSKDDLCLAYSGVRSKIIKDNEPYNDFLIQSPIENYVEALGIDSPGLTSAPMIAREIIRLL
jgi:L-2-hydroxyglutarate oxidase LhgO